MDTERPRLSGEESGNRRLSAGWPGRLVFAALAVQFATAMTGCANISRTLPASGPSAEAITQVDVNAARMIELVPIDSAVVRRLNEARRRNDFSTSFVSAAVYQPVLGAGDGVEISIWEAPPATLFGAADATSVTGGASGRAAVIPEQTISVDGTISIPHVGQLAAAGISTDQLARAIAAKLNGKANQPQVLVRLVHNVSAAVTVVGEVTQSLRMPLTAHHERLLDSLAIAGGVRAPVSKVAIQLTRAAKVASMPLDQIIRDPAQNVLLDAGDVVTAIVQPLRFLALGATGRNEEVQFEAQGISLAQAIARSGGVQDARADAHGVFVFRFEQPEVLAGMNVQSEVKPVDGRIPAVYLLDLANPVSLFVAQNFPVEDNDIVYVANAPAAELQKFLNILTSSVFTVNSLVNLRP